MQRQQNLMVQHQRNGHRKLPRRVVLQKKETNAQKNPRQRRTQNKLLISLITTIKLTCKLRCAGVHTNLGKTLYAFYFTQCLALDESTKEVNIQRLA